jgi:Histidine phosphatase superfamily (branch 1)
MPLAILLCTGREQALMTGKRLREANLTYSEIIHSTMDRAAETARIIHECLNDPNLPIRPDDMLVEGGPIPPKPTITYWQLPQKVRRVSHVHGSVLQFCTGRSVFPWETPNFDHRQNQRRTDGDQTWHNVTVSAATPCFVLIT